MKHTLLTSDGTIDDGKAEEFSITEDTSYSRRYSLYPTVFFISDGILNIRGHSLSRNLIENVRL